ncbi:MAG: hypothetical protein U0984_03215 [Prosthecobacter sp.]|nr:hypothetical protein [Prosthecobacter sp.]
MITRIQRPSRSSFRKTPLLAGAFRPSPPETTAAGNTWDVGVMIRALSARFPNMDPRLLGWVLLACKLQHPSESPGEGLADAETLIRSKRIFGAAVRQALICR